MKNNIIVGMIALVLCGYGVVATPNVAEAACGYNGYFHSGGKCSSSYNHDDDDHDEDEDDDDRDDRRQGGKFKNYNGGYYAYDNAADLEYLRAYIQRLLLILSQLDQGSDTSNVSDVDVRTLSATDIDENSATLRAVVDMNSEDDAELYFEYGRTSGNLSSDTTTQNLDAADDGDTLEDSISGLLDNTRYYYRAVAIDTNGDKDYGTTLSFVTDDSSSSNGEDPVATTQSARNIDSNSAELRGTVDMHDFSSGTVFFVYGEDESQVADVENDFSTYDEVDEDGNNLEKVLVDSDLDGTDSYVEEVTGLDNNTDLYFALCVEYEDADSDPVLTCGTVRTFDTL